MIVASAIRGNGLVLTLPKPARHHDIIRAAIFAGVETLKGAEQGFLTSDGEFLTRKSALVHALACDQVRGGKTIGSVLTSEDLW